MATAPKKTDKPNILVIWGDDIGQSNLSCYTHGLMGYRTPNIDRLAKEGVLFTDSYGEQSCTAGRSSFITGQSVLRTGLSKVGAPAMPVGMNEQIVTIAALLTHLLMWGLFELFVKTRNDAAPAAEFPLAAQQERRLPAGPRLQAIPANEIYEFRQRENTELREYGWVDRNAGTVRIPIEKAKELLLQRGLPSRAPADASREGATGTGAVILMPADSSAGRTMERRR